MKYLAIIFIVAGFVSTLSATENKISKSREIIYSNLLSRYNCVLGPDINNPQWIVMKRLPMVGEHITVINLNLKKVTGNNLLIGEVLIISHLISIYFKF